MKHVTWITSTWINHPTKAGKLRLYVKAKKDNDEILFESTINFDKPDLAPYSKVNEHQKILLKSLNELYTNDTVITKWSYVDDLPLHAVPEKFNIVDGKWVKI